jgi:Fic family protein
MNKKKYIENIPQDFWKLINQIDELKGQWIGGAKMNPQALGRLKRSVLVTSTGASTRIEGAQLTDEDIEKMMRGLSMQKFKDRDIEEAKGYYELLENVFNAWDKIPFSESSIKHLHKELLKYTEKDKLHRGEYKKIENKVEMINEAGQSIGILFGTTPAWLTPKEMQELIIANFLIEFLNIHPFQDGNGRLSRVLTNILLLKAGYSYVPYISHEKLIEDNKSDYYLSLRKSQKTLKMDKVDISAWIEFFLKVLLTQAKQAIELLSKENVEKLLSPKQLLVWQYLLNVSEATPGEISKKTKVARPTVSQAIDVLLKLKKIERIGQGRTTRYKKK